MDDRLEKALEFSNYRKTIALQQKNLKLRIDTLLNISYNNGVFKSTNELMSFVFMLTQTSEKSAIVRDISDNPIMIDDLADFLSELKSAYHSAMNEHMIGITKLKKARSIKTIMDW